MLSIHTHQLRNSPQPTAALPLPKNLKDFRHADLPKCHDALQVPRTVGSMASCQACDIKVVPSLWR